MFFDYVISCFGIICYVSQHILLMYILVYCLFTYDKKRLIFLFLFNLMAIPIIYYLHTFKIETCSDINFEFKCPNIKNSFGAHFTCTSNTDLMFMSYKIGNETIIENTTCNDDDCIDPIYMQNFLCVRIDNSRQFPKQVKRVYRSFNYIRMEYEKKFLELMSDQFVICLCCSLCILLYFIIFGKQDDYFDQLNNQVLYLLPNSDSSQEEEAILNKMPEKISSLLKEEDRKCLICWEIVDFKNIFTYSKCYCVYHKECFEMGGWNKCVVCKK